MLFTDCPVLPGDLPPEFFARSVECGARSKEEKRDFFGAPRSMKNLVGLNLKKLSITLCAILLATK
jgi:hypothetical protein